MLIRVTAYFLRMVGRRFLKKGKIDSSDYSKVSWDDLSMMMPGTSWYLGNIAKDWIERDIKICVQ